MAMTRSVHNNAPDALAFVHQVESAGAAGKITVSEAIYHRTKDLFDFEPRGGVEVDLMSLRGISSASLYTSHWRRTRRRKTLRDRQSPGRLGGDDARRRPS
jgi:hypothetical protein